MITVHCDYLHQQAAQSGPRTWVVSGVADYIELRRWVRAALDDSFQNYDIYIHAPLIANWLRDLQAYGSGIVCWNEASLRDQLEQQSGVLAPAELSDAAILALGLLTLPSPEREENRDPLGWILRHLLDPLWGSTEPKGNHLAALSAWMLDHAPQRLGPELLGLTRKRLEQWATTENAYRIFLEHDWPLAAAGVLLRWSLHSYPLTFPLPSFISSAPPTNCSAYPDACMDAAAKHTAALTQAWRSWLALHPDTDLSHTVQWMSGFTEAELGAIEHWAERAPQQVTRELISAVQLRFAGLEGGGALLGRLEMILPPPLPRQPEGQWEAKEWLSWATHEYIPYFAWVIRNHQERGPQMVMAQQFADWLVRVYPGLWTQGDGVLLTNQYTAIRKALQEGRADTVFWFIIDGLTWWHAEILSRLCVERGIGVANMQPALSALPSVTFISKRALVQGVLDRGTVGRPIMQVLQERLKSDGLQAHVYGQPDELRADMVAGIQPGVYALLYNTIDHLSHTEHGFTDNEDFQGPLKRVAGLAEEGLRRAQRQGARAIAFVSSDHGSTLLPNDATTLPVPRFARELVDEDTADEVVPAARGGRRAGKVSYCPRACSVDTLPSSDDQQALVAEWYFLHRESFGLHQHFLIPRGYQAVGTRQSTWTHGGATPEETVTAFIELQPEAVEFRAPMVELQGSLSLGKTSELRVVITNPNPMPIERVEFWIEGLEGTQAPLEDIGSISRSEATILVRVESAQGDKERLEWSLRCEALGQKYQFGEHIDVPVRRMQSSDLDEWFEELK